MTYFTSLDRLDVASWLESIVAPGPDVTPEDGGTAWRIDGPTHRGYAVALKAHERIFSLAEYIGDYDRLEAEVLQYAEDHWLDGAGIGFWVHEGLLYLDVVIHTLNREFAMEKGRIEKQLTIYDITNNEVITL